MDHAFAQHPPRFNKEAFQLWQEQPGQQWHDSIRWQELKWYHQAKAHQGAFATLLGIMLEEPTSDNPTSRIRSKRWSAVAVGDACLFQIRGDVLLKAFPLEAASEFGTNPSLLSTQADYNERSLGALTKYNGTHQIGDVFLLMTDALAHWFLTEFEGERQPWIELNSVEADDFSTWIGNLRQASLMHNDDVTLVRCFQGADQSAPKQWFGFGKRDNPDYSILDQASSCTLIRLRALNGATPAVAQRNSRWRFCSISAVRKNSL